MTKTNANKIYEYIDEANWFLGEWVDYRRMCQTFSGIAREERQLLERINDELAGLVNRDRGSFSTVVVKYHSPLSYIQFVLDMINEAQATHFKVVSHKGAILITHHDKLKKIFFLSQQEISLNDFFGKEGEEVSVGDTILIATRNEGKTAEFRKLFDKLGYRVENLNDYPELPEVEERGTTFEENARLKAETISQQTGKMVLADDSGLEVDVLGGMPGVWSARFAGRGASDDENNIKLLHELAMVFDIKDRSAHFHTTLVVASPDRESLVVEADWPGYIAHEPKGENGFGYDPLFLVGETGKTSAELTLEEKNAQSHRAQAVQKLVEVFPAWQSKQS
ncbi:nucleoside-triphosphate diphosphatase [Streptococcus panodentis]|uniref:dITP/XTP pyrophosphatase n=1 Tax=Streptococcus panodentis TaxID=1581472 RepID=A0ABS5AY86_9STRE|nr:MULTISPECIES: nucleoside-triphosphate diphosphatase [Streptococcus]KXT84702.1 Nucleoside 5-triphosphatase RdgB (dHAPTP, dITP, XTP-specific) [Streptococcus sp. DD11]MBP2621221.1 non-canonical purine NTP pyrophosphatase [Streptococcus panodentis]